jgi:putative ABC transport system permease protein
MPTDWRTLTATDPRLTLDPSNAQYDVGLRPGTDPAAYVQALGPKLGSNYGVSINQNGGAAIAMALAGTLTLLLSTAAGLGVLNTVVLHTREHVHDLACSKSSSCLWSRGVLGRGDSDAVVPPRTDWAR